MENAASYFLTWQAVALVGALAISGPLLYSVFSPWLLLLLSPLFILLLLLGFIAAAILIPHTLDQRSSRRHVSKRGIGSRRGQAGRPFAFSTPAAWQAVLTRSQWSYASPHTLPPLIPSSPAVSLSLNNILILIVRDFVLSWYTRISPSPSFPSSVSGTLQYVIRSLIGRTEKVDLASFLVKRLLPKINAHIDCFCESEKALRGVGLERRLTQSDELDLLLASRYSSRNGKRLHPAVDNLSTMLTKPTEEVYIRSLVERILPLLLPEEEAGSRAVRVAAREIVTTCVLAPVLEMLGDPDFWNRMIDQFVSLCIFFPKCICPLTHEAFAHLSLSQAGAAIHEQ